MCGWPNKTWHSLSALDRYTLTMVLKNSDASKYQHAVYQGFKNQVTERIGMGIKIDLRKRTTIVSRWNIHSAYFEELIIHCFSPETVL